MIETKIGAIADPTERFFAFIQERHSISLKKARGEPKPWTEDSILQSYRFCNVYRERDSVTIWIRENWREPHADDPDLWFAMVVARFINLPETLAEIGYPVPWDPEKFRVAAAKRAKAKVPVYNAAYMTRSAPGSKIDYHIDHVFDPLWVARERLRPRPGDSLNSYHMLLGQFHGLGSFMTAQVIADLKYAQPLASAVDWSSFAASGPGSRRGLNRVLGRAVDSPWREDEWRGALGRLRVVVQPMFAATGTEMVHNQDLQNCLCEWDKWERMRLGQGRPKQLYKGV